MKVLRILSLILQQAFSAQTLKRTPEPTQTTNDPENVSDYNQALTTKLAIPYTAIYNILYRILDFKSSKSVVDLACGPGHLTIQLKKHLPIDHITGVDLAPNMIQVASDNAKGEGMENSVTFLSGDITRLDKVVKESFDVSLCTDAFHHLPTLEMVSHLLREMARITKKEGVVFIFDANRLKTKKTTDEFINLFLNDYFERGLERLYLDAKNSWFAAWTKDELCSALPKNTERKWVHLTLRPFPAFQMLIGLPAGRNNLFLRPSLPKKRNTFLSDLFELWRSKVGEKWAKETLSDFQLLELFIKTAKISWQ